MAQEKVEGEDGLTRNVASDGKVGALDQEYLDGLTLEKVKVKGSGALWCMQYKAMFIKRFNHFKRARNAFCCELLLPLILMYVGVYLSKNMVFMKVSPTRYFTDDFYPVK